jgi:Putative adhesin
MHVAGISRPALLAMVAVAVALFAGGITWAASWLTRHTETHTRVLSATPTIEILGNNGDIEVIGSDRTDLRLTTKEQRSVFGRPRVDVAYRAGQLRLKGHCSAFELPGSDAGCRVSFRLEVPRDASVRLMTQSSDVIAEDLRHDADLQASSGDVAAFDVLGTLRLHTSSGDVHADSSSGDIDASTKSGDVDVRASNPVRVRAETSSGDVHVRVPDRTYAVGADTKSGDEHVEVREDDRAPRRLDARTSSGDVHIERSA